MTMELFIIILDPYIMSHFSANELLGKVLFLGTETPRGGIFEDIYPKKQLDIYQNSPMTWEQQTDSMIL